MSKLKLATKSKKGKHHKDHKPLCVLSENLRALVVQKNNMSKLQLAGKQG